MHHLRAHSVEDRPRVSQRPFEPTGDIFNNSGIIGLIAQTALRVGVGSLSSFVAPAFNPVFVGSLTFGSLFSNGVGTVVNDELTQDRSDSWAIQAITKLALVVI